MVSFLLIAIASAGAGGDRRMTGQLANQEMNVLNNALSLATTRMAAFRTALANLSTVSYTSSSGYYPTPSNGSSAGVSTPL
jgi:hypothetical protein